MTTETMWAILRRLALGDRDVGVIDGQFALSMYAAQQAVGGFPAKPPLTPEQIAVKHRLAVAIAISGGLW